MKKLLYIFSLVILAISCTSTLTEVDGISDTQKVAIDFSVQVNDASLVTRTMSDNPQLENLMLAVFDEAGYLVEYTWAADGTEYADENGVKYVYKAHLTQSKTPRVIHFIGNAPQSLKFGTEEAVMASLSSSLGSEHEDMYWYRKELPAIDGTNSGDAMLVDDNGESGPILQATTQTLAYLDNIPLIRNFAKIVLTSSTEDFVLESFFVAGTPRKGMAAAYNYSTGSFVDYFTYLEGENTETTSTEIPVLGSAKTYEYLTLTEKYDANVPVESDDVTLAEASARSVQAGASYFVYEREKPLTADAAPYIIAYGEYSGDGQKYFYKIDLRDNSGYFPILRNFQYNVDIKTVTRPGYLTIEEAAKSSGSGDISSSMSTVSLTYISDGIASLEVDYTEKYLVSADEVELGFRFIPDVNDEDEYGLVSDMWIVVNASGTSGAAIETINGYEYEVGEEMHIITTNPGSVIIKPTIPENAPKTQTLTIYARYTRQVGEGNNATMVNSILQRTVKFIVQTPREMLVELDPYEVPKFMGSEFDMSIKIPGGLSASIFPLQFAIEAEQLSINPAQGEHMPVQTGTSINGGNKSAFYFIKTLRREEYLSDQENVIICRFKTSKAISATDIYVVNDYFTTRYIDADDIANSISVYLDNFDAQSFEDLKFSKDPVVCAADVAVDFTFTMTAMPKDNVVRLSLAGVKPADDDDESFTYIGIEDGKAVYEYTVSALSERLALVTTDIDSELYVGLDAYHFIHAEETAERDWMEFSSLTIPTRVTQGIGQSVKITFKLANGDTNQTVTATFENMEVNGLNPYTFSTSDKNAVTTNNGTYTINNVGTTDANGELKVTLSAPGYKPKTVICSNRRRGTFTTMSLNKDELGGKSGEEVTLTFAVSDYEPDMTVTVDLDGLLPNDNTLTTKAGTYTYKVTGTVNQTVKLKTEKVDGKPCTITLSADDFESESISVNRYITIPKSKLIFTNTIKDTFSNGGKIYIYTDSDYLNEVANYSYTRSKNNNTQNAKATNSADIKLYGVSVNDKLYLRHTNGKNQYNGSFTLTTDLINGTSVTVKVQ